jgi:hypothetical protein
MKKLFALLLIFIFCTSAKNENIKEIHYSYLGNFKALISRPNKPSSKKLPVIIYNYDEYYDWIGKNKALKKGYDLHKHMKEFNHWGFICIVPLERYRKLNALKGAIKYANNLPDSNPNEIHVVGLSEGAFLSIISLKNLPKVTSLSLLAPQTINHTGFLSIPQLLRDIEYIKSPILFILGIEEKEWRIKIAELLLRILQENKKEITYLEYPVDKKWFRNHKNAFMSEIHRFITGKPAPPPSPKK